MASEKFVNGIKVFTLNVWGLRYISKHRERRIKLIAEHLAQKDYDIVFLQEVWTESDFEFIRNESKAQYVFAHMYKNASLLGTSGLVILAKWTPSMIHFYPFSINGSPFRINHGDWFSAKGVGYARIEIDEYRLHLFCTHMHAQYDENETLADQYSVHRICQAYELAKYINLMVCSCSAKLSKDLIIMAGDMNTSSKEPPYRILNELTGIRDAYKFNRRKRISFMKERICTLRNYDPSDEDSDEDIITCGHRENTFTNPKQVNAKWSKRIDFIFYKLCDNQMKMSPLNNEQNYHTVLCYPEPIKISSKDCSGLSYSDHQPVAAKLMFHYTDKHICETIQEESSTTSMNGSSTNNKNDSSDSETENGASQSLSTKISRSLARFTHPNQQQINAYHNLMSPTPKSLLPEIETLLEAYINENTPIQSWCTIMFVLLLISGMMAFVKYLTSYSLSNTLFTGAILCLLFLFCSLLRFFSARHEMNGLRAILNDLKNVRTFKTKYGSTN